MMRVRIVFVRRRLSAGLERKTTKTAINARNPGCTLNKASTYRSILAIWATRAQVLLSASCNCGLDDNERFSAIQITKII